jgi:uncharacterized membrane protein (DUF4010 family)
MQLPYKIPVDFVNFILITVFSLIIGLEQRRHHSGEEQETLFGLDRTYTFVGILGFILYNIAPDKIWLFAFGGIAITSFLAIFYWQKIEDSKKYGITSMIILLITYSLTPLLYLKPIWLTILIVASLLVFTELKQQFRVLTGKFENDEFINLAKFLAISGIILPLLPHEIISDFIPISAFKFWLVVVVVTGVSYLSYLLKKFIFPQNGVLITGFLGGLYSSTATTVVLARKSKDTETATNQVAASIIMATGMMFIRIYVLIIIFNQALAEAMALHFSILTVITFAVAFFILKAKKTEQKAKINEQSHKNPLEIKTAFLFAGLFVVFAVLTKYVLKSFGVHGLNLLSVIVGVTDIDPFLMSLFTGKYQISLNEIANATLIAITSNNLMKLAYGLSLGNKQIRKPLIIGFSIIVVATIILILV